MSPERVRAVLATAAVPAAITLLGALAFPATALGESVQLLRAELATELRYDSEGAVGGDVQGKLIPRLGYERASARSRLALGYGLDLTRHLGGAGISLDHRGELEWRLRATRRLALSAQGALYRVAESTSLPRFGVAYAQAGAFWSFGEVRARHRRSRIAHLEVSARSEWNRLIFPEGAGELAAPLSGMQSLQVSERYRATRLSELGWAVRGQLFSGGDEVLGGSGALLFVSRFRLAPHTALSFEAGPRLYRAGRTTTWDAQLRLQLDWARRGLELALIAGRDYVGAAGFASTLWTEFAQGGLGLVLSRRVRVFGYAGAFRNGLAQRRDADALGYGASLGVEWAFADHLLARLAFDRLGQLDLLGGGYSMGRNIVALRVGYRAPVRLP